MEKEKDAENIIKFCKTLWSDDSICLSNLIGHTINNVTYIREEPEGTKPCFGEWDHWYCITTESGKKFILSVEGDNEGYSWINFYEYKEREVR